MLRRLGALLVCVALVTAGCIGSVSAGTADEHRSTADEQAREFAGSDAELVSVGGFESNESSREDVEERGVYGSAILLTDDELGDGQAPAWVYSYRAGNQTYRVAVDEDGTVIANETDDDVDEDQQPIEEWSVPSDEAAETVADNEDSWSTGGDGFGVYFLSQDDEETDPTWKLAQITEEGLVVARVNANTGEFLGAQTRSIDGPRDFSIPPIYGPGDDEGPPEQPEQEGGSFSGTLTAAEPTAEHDFEVEEEGHREIGVRLALQNPSPGSTVNATIEGPEGTVGSLEASGETVEVIEDWPEPAPGEYTIVVELADGVSQDYEIDWCASGPSGGDEEADDPCERVSEGTQPGSALAPWPR